MINGERVRLRPVEKDDLPRYVKWFQDPQVRAGLTIFMPLSQGQEEKWFQNHLDGFPANQASQPLAIDTPADDGKGWVHIGSCGFHDIDWRARKAEFGIVIGDKAYWNKGLGTDALRTLWCFGFDDLNLNRIWATSVRPQQPCDTHLRKSGLCQRRRVATRCVQAWQIS